LRLKLGKEAGLLPARLEPVQPIGLSALAFIERS